MAEKIQYYVRISADKLQEFKDKCGVYGRDHSDVTRELLQAYAEDRVSITLTPEKLQERKVYHEPGE